MNNFALYWYEISSQSAKRTILKLMGLSYRAYLQTNHWYNFRQVALEHYDYTCQKCGVAQPQSKSKNKSNTVLSDYLLQLEVHHEDYHRLGQERMEDVQVLCRECHESVHSVIEDFMFETSLKMRANEHRPIAP